MIQSHYCLFRFFSTIMKPLYIQIGKQSIINAKAYINPIAKITLLSSNETISNIQSGQTTNINKSESIHLMLIPKHTDINLTLSNCTSNMSIHKANFNHLSLNITNSSINFKEKIMKQSSNLSLILNQSKINLNSIQSINNLSLQSKSDSQIDIKSLSANYFKAEVEGNNVFNCSLTKIRENSLLHYSNDTKLNFTINPLALWTLINVYCVNRKSFINLPLGVLGGKIGSTSFPTLILFNKDRLPRLINSLHKPILSFTRFNIRLVLVLMGLSAVGMYQTYSYYFYSNEAYTRCKLNQYLLKKNIL